MERKRLLKLLVYICLVLVLLTIPILAACTTETGEQEEEEEEEPPESFTLRLATGSPEFDNPVTNEFKEWAANVEEASDGRLTIDIYWAGALGESADALAMLDSGICDMIMEGYGYFVDTFPVSDVITLPYLVTSTVAAGTLMNGLLADGLLPEYDDIKLLAFKPQDPIMIFSNERITTLADIEGLKIRTNTEGWTNIITALGGVPQDVATPDLYTSLETGVIDGICTSLGFFYPMGMYEVCDYALVEPMGMSMTFIAMSWDAWNRLPADLQLILEEASWQYYWTNVSHESDRYLNSYLGPVEDAGCELLYLSDAERANFVAATSSLVDDWIDEVDGKGLAGSEAVRRARLLQEVLP